MCTSTDQRYSSRCILHLLLCCYLLVDSVQNLPLWQLCVRLSVHSLPLNLCGVFLPVINVTSVNRLISVNEIIRSSVVNEIILTPFAMSFMNLSWYADIS